MMKTVILAALIACCTAVPLKFKDCGSVGAKISSVSSPQCTTDPCVLHHGLNYSISVDFTATENSATAKTVVHGIIAGVPVPFPVASDCCNDNQLKCPIVNGTEQTYTNTIFCSPDYPKIKLIGKFEVLDDNQKDFFCFVVPLEIQD